ncbi:MAG: hypothetical protein WDW36_001263 [Sanguina aurantia]
MSLRNSTIKNISPSASAQPSDPLPFPVFDAKDFEILRWKKEAEYHKRLRQAADQHSFQLEEQLSSSRISNSNWVSGFDEAQQGLREESQGLLTKNSELTHQLNMAAMENRRLRETQALTSTSLEQVHAERDEVTEERDALKGDYDELKRALAKLTVEMQERCCEQQQSQPLLQPQQLQQQLQQQQAQQPPPQQQGLQQQPQQQPQQQQQQQPPQQQQQPPQPQQQPQQQAEEVSRFPPAGIQTQDCLAAAGVGPDPPGTDNSLHELLDAAQVTCVSDHGRMGSMSEHGRR